MYIDESCIGKNGKQLYGTAAFIHKVFGKSESEQPYDMEKDKEECRRIIAECKYAVQDEESI